MSNLKKILEEYMSLKDKTSMEAFDFNKNKKIEAKYINSKDVLRREELKKELEDKLELLSDEDLKLLYEDDDIDLVSRAIKIRASKRINNIDKFYHDEIK